MNTVADKRSLKLFVTGNFGFEGFLELRSLLEARGKAKPTLFSDREQSTVLSDAATFDVETDLNDAELRRLVMKVNGVEDVSFREANHA